MTTTTTPDPIPHDPDALRIAMRSEVGKIGAHAQWANRTTPEDRAAATKPARDALAARWLAEADGDPVQARHLMREHMARVRLAKLHRAADVARAEATLRAEQGTTAGGAR